jgi:hypothetical protein
MAKSSGTHKKKTTAKTVNHEVKLQISEKKEDTEQIGKDDCKWKNCLKYWLEILVCVFTIGGVILGLCTYTNDVESRRKEITNQYLIGFYDLLETVDPILLDTINFFNHKQLDTINYDTTYGEIKKEVLENLLQNNKKWRLQLDNIMVYLNQFAIGCQEGFYDEYTAWYSNYYKIINAVSALQPYIDIRAKEENLEEKYGKYSRPCGFLRAMVYRWNHTIGECDEWEKNDRVKGRKIRDDIEKWKAKNNK